MESNAPYIYDTSAVFCYNKTKDGGIQMIFNTHDKTPRMKTKKSVKIFFIIFYTILLASFFFMAIIISVDYKSIIPFLIALVSISIITVLISMWFYNILKAYVEIDNDMVKVVNYSFFRRREKMISLQDIEKAKYSYGGGVGVGIYIVFKDKYNKTLFRIFYTPESKAYFENLGFKIT